MAGRITLAIETSNPSTAGVSSGVAIGETSGSGVSRVLGVEAIAPDRRNDDDLMPAIARLTARLGVRPGDIARVAVSVGPGGFTALRVAIASAKMIAEVHGAACVNVPSAQVAALRMRDPGGSFAVALSSKGEDTYVSVFDATGLAIGAGRIMDAAEIAGLEIGVLVADRFLPASVARALVARAVTIGAVASAVPGPVAAAGPGGRPVRFVTPEFDAAACFEASLGLPEVDAMGLSPLYPREPEAVRKWRELRGTREKK